MMTFETATKKFIPIRAVIWLMLFTCTFIFYMLRINLSIILLAMVKSRTTNDSTIAIPECILKNSNYSLEHIKSSWNPNLQTMIHGETFDWSPQLQGLILGAYFWGFVIAGIPAAAIAEKFGPRRTVTIACLISTLMTVLGPWLSSIHANLLITSRFITGLFGAVTYPAIHCLISKWAPPSEKGKFISATLGGSLGTVVTWPLLGHIIGRYGWEWAFYVTVIIAFIWTFIWVFLVYDTPNQHPWVTNDEKEYIESSLAGTLSVKSRIPPYKSIILSIPVWSLIIAQFGNLWGLFFLMTAGPNFMATVLGFDIGHTGFMAALPYLARMIMGFIFGIIGDLIVRNGWMSRTTIRKSFITFSHLLPGILLLFQTLAGCNVNWAIAILALSLASNGASTLTNLSNAQDLAPNFAGSLYGIANCIGSTTGFITPMIVGYLTAEHNGLYEWHKIFYIGALVYIGCGIIFIIFGKGDIQKWNYQDDDGPTEAGSSKGGGADNPAFVKENK